MSTKRIDTLGDLLRHSAGAVLAITCRCCPRGTVRYAASDVAGFYGAWRPVRGLRFRCDNCGESDADLAIERPESSGPQRPRPIE